MITAILTILFAIIGASIVWNVIGTVGRIIMKLQVFLRFLKVFRGKK